MNREKTKTLARNAPSDVKQFFSVHDVVLSDQLGEAGGLLHHRIKCLAVVEEISIVLPEYRIG